MSAKEKAKKKDDKGKKEDAPKTVISLEPPSGTRDFFPDDMRQQRWLFTKFREVANLYGFQEYDAPVLEHEELYKRKAGEEITQQMYNFVDKEGALVTLRPEMTPTLARMVLNLMRVETGEMAAQLPLKWFSIPQCWRFETTQRGRKREHYQWNMDIVGLPTIYAEAEVLSAVVTFFESVGITSKDVGLKVNSRKVLGAVLKNAGVPDKDFAPTCVIIDKQDKIGADAVKKELQEQIGLKKDVCDRIVDATSATTLEEFASLAGVGDSEEVKELQKLFDLAADYGYGDWLQFDASVVRGLAYYTGVVFEGFDKAGQLRAICGGGRYDRLLTLYGSPKEVPCIGFGFGDCVIVELLKEKGVTPNLPATVDFVVAAFNLDMMGQAYQVARRLRLAGKSVDVFTEASKKVAKAFNYADRVGAVRIAFVAPDEWAKGMVRIKDLRNFKADDPDDLKQRDVPLDDLVNVDSYFGGVPSLVRPCL
jgi:histidyl-tRNA synthetase